MSFNSSKYFGVDAKVDIAKVLFVIKRVPEALKEELLDALDHIYRSSIKGLYHNTQFKNRRWITVKSEKHPGQFKFFRAYIDPANPKTPNLRLKIRRAYKFIDIHETGGTIAPKKARMLAIPIGGALTGSGRVKKSVTKHRGNFGSIRGLFPIVSGGKVLLAKKNRNGKVTPYFVLKNRVRIQPRLRFYETWGQMAGYRAKILNKAVSKAIKKV